MKIFNYDSSSFLCTKKTLVMQIELTEEQRAKLLKMVEFLFPEYDTIFVGDVQIDVHDSTMMVGLFNNNKNFKHTSLGYPTEGKYIHWFEFCFTYLISRLIAIKGSFDVLPELIKHAYQHHINDYTNSAILDSRAQHPIDYLYNIFNSLRHD